jgi:small subunit ribosomal protein S6
VAENTYECLFLLDPNKSSSDWDGVMSGANGQIERHGGQILVTRPWDAPKLAYPIKKFRKGTYLLTYFKADPKNVPAMEHDFKLQEPILRHMILKLHPQIAEEILAHLNGEGPQPTDEPEPAGKDREPAGRR